MAEPYNLSILTGQDNLVGIMQASNTLSTGLLGIVILLLAFIVLFVAFKAYDVKRALATSSFISSIVAVFLRLLSMISDQWMFGMFIVTGLSVVFLVWGGD